jgi:uncharacterized protein YaiI (UPF0178 family)
MQIWVDADACPRVIKDMLYRAAGRRQVMLTLVANNPLVVPHSPYVKTVEVPAGLDVADKEIVNQIDEGDLVITADIPLAAAVIGKGGHALNPRGTFYTEENIHDILAMRNLMDELRNSGEMTGGPAAFGSKEKQAFANRLDSFLTRYHT